MAEMAMEQALKELIVERLFLDIEPGAIEDDVELAEYGVTVNAVAPGPVETERLGPAMHDMNEVYDYSPNRMTPLRRLAQPVEIAHAVLFLASDEAAYITGHTLPVTGGR